jgi:hypothetical protein
MEYSNPNQPWLPPGYDPYKDMSDTERMTIGCVGVFGIIAGVVAALLLCALFASCTTTKYVPVERHTVDTLRLTQTVRDSIYLSDSIYVSDFVRDDTVYKTIDRWHTRYVERTRTDTVYQSRTDSIPMPYPAIKEVPAELTWWQQARLHMANIVLILLAVACVVWAVRLYLKNRLPH